MRLIKELSEHIKDEANDVCEYAKLAVRLKAEGRPNAAQLFAEIAKQEANHADKIHELAVKEVSAARSGDIDVPVGMEQIWQWEHDELMDRMAHAREMLAML